MSNAVMDTHSMIFVTIGHLVSPSSSVNGDPLFDFPDHWPPRFSAQFPIRRTSEGADRPTPPPPNEISVRSRLQGNPGPQAVGGCCLTRVNCETRWLLIRGASIRHVTTGLGGPRFRWYRDRFLAQLFCGSNTVLDISSVFAAALKIQLMSPASDHFS